MSVFLDLSNGRPACDLSSITSAFNGPVLGPFLGVHLTRDEVRVATTSKEFALQRVGPDWLFYGGVLYADIAVIAEDQIGPGRRRRLTAFDATLCALTIEDIA